MEKKNNDFNQLKVEKGSFAPPPRPQAIKNDIETIKVAESDIETVKVVEQESLEVQNPEKNQKKTLTESQKIVVKKTAIISSALLVLVLGIYIAITTISANIKANAPLVITDISPINLVQSQDEFYLVAPYQEDADLYFFEIQKSGETQISEIESLNNIVAVDGIFSQAGVYQVRFAIQKASKPSTKSEFSARYAVTSTQKLETPIFEYNSILKQFSWQDVQNADAYKLYYFQDDELKSITISDFEVNLGTIKVNLEDLNLDLGIYEFSLIAINSEKDYFISSDFNQKISVNNFEKLDTVESGNYDFDTKILIITLKEYREDLKLKISYGENQSITINFADEGLEHNFWLPQYNGLSFEISDRVEVSLVSEENFVLESNLYLVEISN